MHDIIKKALDEALTEKYHAELMGCAETDYNFSVGFVADMKALIRRTDNKLIYYSKYIAAVACAVIAIGCAVLLPNLMDSSIDVEPPVTETTSATSVTENTPETTTSLSPDSANPIVTDSTTPTVTTPDYSEPVTSTEPDVTNDAEYSPSTSDTDAETQNGTVTEETPPVDIPEDDAEVEGDSSADTVTDDDIPEDEDDTSADGIDNPEDDASEDDTDSDDDAVIEGDDVVIEDSSDDDDVAIEDDDCEVEDDEVAEDDTDSDDDTPIEDGDDVVIEDDEDWGDDAAPVLVPLEGTTFKETCEYIISYESEQSNTLEELYITGMHGMNKEFNLELCDFSFVKDYLVAQGSAPLLEEIEFDFGDSIYLNLSAYPRSYSRTFFDNSPRNNYEDFFGYGIETDEAVEDDDDAGAQIEVRIYDSGIISVRALWFNSETAYFTADKTATTELFDRLSEIGLPANAQTVGDIINGMNITAANMSDGYAEVIGLYDIKLENVPVKTDSMKQGIVDILAKYSSSVCTIADDVPVGWISRGIGIEVGLKDTSTLLRLVVLSEDTLDISDGHGSYLVKLKKADFRALISLICKEAGVAAPVFYETAADYLSDKPNFEALRSISIYKDNNYYNIYSEEKLAELLELIKSELGNARYNPFGRTWKNTLLHLYTTAWDFRITEENEFIVFYNCFESGTDLYNKVLMYILENADEIQAASTDVETDDVCEDEIDEVTDEIDETDDVDIEGEEQWAWEDGDIAVDD